MQRGSKTSKEKTDFFFKFNSEEDREGVKVEQKMREINRMQVGKLVQVQIYEQLR